MRVWGVYYGGEGGEGGRGASYWSGRESQRVEPERSGETFGTNFCLGIESTFLPFLSILLLVFFL